VPWFLGTLQLCLFFRYLSRPFRIFAAAFFPITRSRQLLQHTQGSYGARHEVVDRPPFILSSRVVLLRLFIFFSLSLFVDRIQFFPRDPRLPFHVLFFPSARRFPLPQSECRKYFFEDPCRLEDSRFLLGLCLFSRFFPFLSISLEFLYPGLLTT